MTGILWLALIGCGDTTLVAPEGEAPTWWADARPIVEARCATCHTEGDIAPFPLTTLDEVRAYAPSVRAAVATRSMPPWPADDDCNTYDHARSLTDDELETLLAWIDADTPEGDPGDAVELEPPPVFAPDLVLTPDEPYTPTNGPDDYRCILVAWPEDEVTYVTGLEVLPDRRDMVHHVVAYAISAEQAPDFVARDEDDDGPGYTCYGGPTGTANTGEVPDLEELSKAGAPRWIGSWVPGSGGGAFPEGTGIRMSPGDLLILQMHYNTASVEPGPDASSVALTLSDTVDRVAAVMPLTNPGWLTNGLLGPPMIIPAGEPEVVHTTELYPLQSELVLSGVGAEIGIEAGDSIVMYSVAHHMHTLGTSGRITRLPADGDEECLLDIPRWDFHWQGAYRFAEPVVLHEEDGISLTCTYDNGAGTEDVAWGEGTGDEMCIGVLYITAQ